MYVHGGYDVDKGVLGDFNKIDLKEDNRNTDYSWVELNNTCEGKVIKLKNHTSINYQDKIIVFGGQKSTS